MRTHVTFQVDFPKDGTPTEPAGRDLAQYLATQLGAAGFAVSAPQIHERYAYMFTCRQAKQTGTVFVALVDDGVQEWLVYAEPRPGLVARWLHKLGIRRSRHTDDRMLHALCSAIHQCLRDNQRFRSVRWYTPEGWDTNPDTGWTRAP